MGHTTENVWIAEITAFPAKNALNTEGADASKGDFIQVVSRAQRSPQEDKVKQMVEHR